MTTFLHAAINDYLHTLFTKTALPKSTVYDAAKYTLLLPGKRIRPLITLKVLEGFGYDPLLYISPACSVELIHTYSLIHDDLPCMDDDITRRGYPSAHIVYGEAIALLAGDLLLTHAFDLLSSAAILSDTKKILLIQTLSHAAGGEGMIGGQMLDILGEGKMKPDTYIFQLHAGKTGALFGYAFAAGGIMAGYKDTSLLTTVGQNIGLAFQIVDDILDATQTSEHLGKPAGSDRKNKKLTILSHYSIEEAYAHAEKLLQNAREKIGIFFPHNNPLEELIDSLLHRMR